MASGRIRRSARRGIAVAVLGWLGVAACSVLMAPSASAAPSATVTIQTVTPPAVSVDKGGTVTFVNGVASYNTGVNLGVLGNLSATVNTDVAVTFFGQQRPLQFGQSTAWTFNEPVTAGTITYTYRIVPQSGLAATVANQVVTTVAGSLPALPAPAPYAVNTIAPSLPNLPSTNLPPLPTVNIPLPALDGTVTPPTDVDPTDPTNPTDPTDPPPTGPAPEGTPGSQYNYDVGGGTPSLSPVDTVAAAAFDPSRYFVPGESLGGVDGGNGGGAGGQPGSYDGAAVPVFGQLGGLDNASLDEAVAADAASAAGGTAPALPAAALAAVVALAAVTAALVRTRQAQRASR
jgi:hypothetical protein